MRKKLALGLAALNALAVAAVPVRGGEVAGMEGDAQLASRVIARSDVVLSYPFAEPDVYRAYGVTVWGWGPDPAWAGDYDRRIRQAYDLGVRVVSTQVNPSILPPPDTAIARRLATEPELRASVAIDVVGQPIITPFWPVDYGNGTHAWWYCTNNPAFVANAHERLRMGFAAGANAFHMDMPYGSANILRHGAAGCFCDWCVGGFREYLADAFSDAQLRAMDVEDVTSFDYREMLAERFETVASFNAAYDEGGVIPLIEEFESFQFSAAARFIESMADLARSIGGPGTVVSNNSGGLRPAFLVAADHPDYFVVEIAHTSQPSRAALVPYQLAEALGKPLALWPRGPDVQYVEAGDRTDLLRTWIALSYAQGGNMMVPHQLWSHTTTSGVEWFFPSIDDYAPLYHFVRDNADAFDGYEPVEQIGVLYSNRAMRAGERGVVTTSFRLQEANVSAGLALAGDDYLPRALDERDLKSRFELLVVPEPTLLEGDQATLLDALEMEGFAVPWVSADDVLERVEPLVSLDGERPLWLFPRKHPTMPDAPIVVHVVNRSYDDVANTIYPQTDVDLRVSTALIGLDKVKGVRLLSPGGAEANAFFETTEDGIRVVIPDVELWTVVEISVAS